MEQVWHDPSVKKGRNNGIVVRTGLVMKDGVEGKGRKQPPVVSGEGRDGSAREEAERRFREMTSGRK